MKPLVGVVGAILSLFAVTLQKPAGNADYFPVGVFSLDFPSEAANLKSDQITRNAVSAELRAMDEPSLFEISQKQDCEIYRFLWLRTFHQPISIRMTINPDGSGDLVAKVMSGRSGYDSGYLITNAESHLVPVEIRLFNEKLLKADFWTLSTRRLKDIYGRDGATWILEGTKHKTYHVVDRWSPHDGSYRDACLYLTLGLAKLKIPDREIY
jgi:hypothetical protein